ncbi:MAG: FecR domain-containing protein, partial [Pseudomonadota bacterium]
MKTHTTLDEKRRKDAINWLVIVEDETVSDADLEAFAYWYTSDPQNISAYEEISTYWKAMGKLSQSDYMEYATLQTVHSIQPANDALHDIKETSAAKKHIRSWLYAAAASFLIAIIGIFAFAQYTSNYTQELVYQSAVGEITPITLDDGSTIILGAESKVVVSLSNKKRSSQLVRGEAFFDVTPDADRPFTVKANTVDVSVTGTEFDVQLGPEQVRVSVAEGSVDVTHTDLASTNQYQTTK